MYTVNYNLPSTLTVLCYLIQKNILHIQQKIKKYMGQSFFSKPPDFRSALRTAVFSRASGDLKTLIASKDFVSENVTNEMFVELVQRHWDRSTIEAFIRVGSVDNLCTLLATAALHQHVMTPFHLVLGQIVRCAGGGVFLERRLDALFPIVVDSDDEERVATFIEFGCFDKRDGRSLRIAVMNQLRLNGTCCPAVISAILRSHVGLSSIADELRQLASGGRFEKSKLMVTNVLNKFLADCGDAAMATTIDCDPAVRRQLKVAVHLMSTKMELDEPTISNVLSFLPRLT